MSEEIKTEIAAEQAAAVDRKSRLSKALPTDRISFSKQQDIIRAYGVAFEKAENSPVSNADVGSLVGMASATISQANSFFSDVGILKKAEGGKFTPAPEVLAYMRAWAFNPEAKAWFKLAPLFKDAWFGQEILARLKFRPLEEGEAIEALAELCSAEPEHKGRLGTLLEYLVLVGLIVREGTTLKIAANSPAPAQAEQHAAPAQAPHASTTLPAVAGAETYSLTLDPSKNRKIVIQAPPMITSKELERIKQWLGFQLLVMEEGAKTE